MEQIELSVAPRTIKGKEVSGLRRSGIVPAVLYGRRAEPVSLQANGRELMRILMKAGSSRLIKLNIEGAVEPRMALVREVQREPIRGTLLHVDFYSVSMTEKITLSIRVRFDGVSPAAALNEGVLTYGNDSVEIECLPADLIDALVVDLTRLVKVGDAVHVSDLQVPETVKILSNPDDLVVRVTRLAAEEAADVVAAVVSTEPEVIKKGKDEEEGEEE
jgi:large subunit ribosomal protein L25